MGINNVFIDVDLTLTDTDKNLYPGVKEAIIELKKFGYSVYVWSATGKKNAEKVVKKYGLAKYVTACLPKPTIIIDDSPESLLDRANVLRVSNQVIWWQQIWDKIFHKDIKQQENTGITLPYIAGILDGEGSICVNRTKGRKFCDISISFYNNHKGVLLDILKVFPGGNLYKVERNRGKWSCSYNLKYGKKEIVKKMLSELSKWVVIKKHQVDTALTYLSIDPLDRKAREECMNKLKDLNKRNKGSTKNGLVGGETRCTKVR